MFDIKCNDYSLTYFALRLLIKLYEIIVSFVYKTKRLIKISLKLS